MSAALASVLVAGCFLNPACGVFVGCPVLGVASRCEPREMPTASSTMTTERRLGVQALLVGTAVDRNKFVREEWQHCNS
jgi:hypothetical protein